MKRISLYALLLASVYTPEVYAKIELQAADTSLDQEDLLRHFKGNLKQEASIDPYAIFLKLVATSGVSAYENPEKVDTTKKSWTLTNISQDSSQKVVTKISSKSLTPGAEFVFENPGSGDYYLTSDSIYASPSSSVIDWELTKESVQSLPLDSRKEEQNISSRTPAHETPLTLDIGEKEILEVFEQALVRLQSKPEIKVREILDTVLEILLKAPLLDTPDTISVDTISKDLRALNVVSSGKTKEESLAPPDLKEAPRLIIPGNSEDSEEAIITSGDRNDVEAFSAEEIPTPPPAPPLSPSQLRLSPQTEKRILSIADIIKESLSGGKSQLRRSASSKDSQQEETFSLGAMGTISGKEASRLAMRMAKLREEAEKHTRTAYVPDEKLLSTTRTGITKAPLTWKKTGPAKIVLKTTPVKGKALSLADALAGGIKLRSTAQNTNKAVDSQDPKDAFRNALKSALTGGVKLRSVKERISQEKDHEDRVPSFGQKLKSAHRTGSVDYKKEEDFFSRNPILQKLRAKVLQQEEQQRRIEEEARVKKPEIIDETNLLPGTSSVSLQSEATVEKQVKSPEFDPTSTATVVLPVQKVEKPESDENIMSSLMRRMSELEFDAEGDDLTNSGWDEDPTAVSVAAVKIHKPEEKVIPVAPSLPSGRKLDIKPAKKGMDFLEHIRSMRRIESSVDEEALQEAIKRSKEFKVAQENLRQKQEEERRLKEQQVSARIAAAQQEQMTNDVLKSLQNRRAALGYDDEDDEDED